MEDKQRLFVGVRVSMDTVARLSEARDAMAAAAESAGIAVRWVTPASYHITLQFLGWSRAEVIEAVRDRVGEALAGSRGFEIDVRGAGAFPDPARARVLWAGVRDGDRLAALAEAVGGATARLGFERDRRPFHPHVTLGRLKKVADVSSVLAPCAEQSFSGTSVDSVILFESRLKSGGSEYVERASWPLEADSNRRKRQTEALDPSLTDNEED